MLNDARVASVGFIKYNVWTTRTSKEKNFKIKLQVILFFYWTNVPFEQDFGSFTGDFLDWDLVLFCFISLIYVMVDQKLAKIDR